MATIEEIRARWAATVPEGEPWPEKADIASLLAAIDAATERAERAEAARGRDADDWKALWDEVAAENDRLHAEVERLRPLTDAFCEIRDAIVGMVYDDGTPYEPREVVEAVRDVHGLEPKSAIEAAELRAEVERLRAALGKDWGE